MTADRYFPLRSAGFWNNPFRALTDDQWADVALVSPTVRELWDRSTTDLQIVGSMGAGKTTTLLGLKALAEDRRQRVKLQYLAQGQDELFGDLTDLDVLLVDEAQRLNPTEWSRLFGLASAEATGAPRLVLTSHRDLAPRLAAAGRTLATITIDRMTLGEYRAVLDRRLTHAALHDRPSASLADDAVEYLLATFGADRRAADRLLYEVFQQLRAADVVDADCLRAARATLSVPGVVS